MRDESLGHRQSRQSPVVLARARAAAFCVCNSFFFLVYSYDSVLLYLLYPAVIGTSCPKRRTRIAEALRRQNSLRVATMRFKLRMDRMRLARRRNQLLLEQVLALLRLRQHLMAQTSQILPQRNLLQPRRKIHPTSTKSRRMIRRIRFRVLSQVRSNIVFLCGLRFCVLSTSVRVCV